MSLSTTDEIRVVDLETKMDSLMDWVDAKLDFDQRAFIAQRIIENTPEE